MLASMHNYAIVIDEPDLISLDVNKLDSLEDILYNKLKSFGYNMPEKDPRALRVEDGFIKNYTSREWRDKIGHYYLEFTAQPFK